MLRARTAPEDGAPGKDGQPFSGTFTSPNGQFSITVDDTGIKLAGPSSSIELKADGTIENRTATSFNVTSGGATNLVAGTSLDLESGGATSLTAGSSLSATSGAGTTLDVGGSLNLQTSDAATVNVGTNLNASIAGAANVVATSLDLKATGTAILEAAGPLTLKGSVINEN